MNIAFYTSTDEQCGIADYSRAVVRSLEKQHATVLFVEPPRIKRAVAFRETGRRMNRAQVAHIQHEYAFFSDLRIPILFPLMATLHFSAFLRSITIPTIVTLHELTPSHIPNPVKRILAYLFLKGFCSVLNRCDRIIVHTDRFRDILLRHGVDKQRVLFIPHPFPAPGLKREEAMEAVRLFRKNHALDGKTVLTMFGFVYPRKGYELALTALRDLNNCVLLIAGGPHPEDTSGYYERLIAHAEQFGLRDRVRMIGYLSEADMDPLMYSTDIFLAPYLDAPGSGSLSRMAVYRKPLIASDIATMTELYNRGFGMLLFPAGDAQALTEAIRRVIADDAERRRIVDQTTAFCNKHSFDRFAGNLLSLLRIGEG